MSGAVLPNPNQKFFQTADLDLATYLMAEDLLVYSHAGQALNKRVYFFFHDPDGQGPTIAANFSTRAPKCSFKTTVHCRDVLRTEVAKVLRCGGR